MNIKIIPHKGSFSKSKEAHARDLYNYIYNVLTDNNNHKVAASFTVNIKSNGHEEIVSEMIDVAMPSRSKNPFKHIIFTLQEGLEFTHETAKKIARDYLEMMGWKGCQAIGAIHQNTKNSHFHLLVNLYQVEKGRCCKDDYDYVKSQKFKSILAMKYGFPLEDHERYLPVGNELIRVEYADSNGVKLPEEARAIEIHTGEESLARIAAKALLPIYRKVTSWQDFHEALAKEGLSYVRKSNGAAIRATIDGETVGVAPSHICRDLSLNQMENRLGKFEEPAMEAVAERQPQPLECVPIEIFKRYYEEKSRRKKAYKEYRQKVEELQADKEKMLKFARGFDWRYKGDRKKILINGMKMHIRDKELALRKEYEHLFGIEGKASAQASPFDAWLTQQAIPAASDIIEAIKKSSRVVRLDSMVDSDETKYRAEAFKTFSEAVDADKYITTVGTKDSYGNYTYCLLDKSNSDFLHGFIPKNIEKNIKNISLLESVKNEYVYIIPKSDTKKHIYIDSVSKEMLLKMKTDGLKPSCVLKTRQNTFQCIFTLRQIGGKNASKIFQELAKELHSRYSNTAILHDECRLPGFDSRIAEANGGQCPILSRYIRDLDAYYRHREQMEGRRDRKQREMPQIEAHQAIPHTPLDRQELYQLHKQNILNFTKKQDQIDYMIAVRLRGTGHNEVDVAAIVKDGESVRKAFSEKGDGDLRRFKAFLGQWRALEEEFFTNRTHLILEQAKRQEEEKKMEMSNV